MSTIPKPHSRGMTLVELLVVVAILGILSVVVLPSLTGTIDSRRYREAARNVSAFIARCQSRALNAREPRGVMFQPVAARPASCVDLFFADTPPVYAGETLFSVASVEKVNGITTEPLPITFDEPTQDRLQQDPGFCVAGDAIQFGGSGAKFKFLPPNRVAMWTEDNQNPRNTSWPRATALPFKVFRQPTRGAAGSLQLQGAAAIDIAWSCLGSRPLKDFVTAGQADKSVSLLFDSSGKPQELVHSGGVRTSIGEPLFLLIGEAELCGNPYSPAVAGEASGTEPDERGGANWQYSDCVWLCVDNNSGVVKFGAVAAGAKTVLESQRNVRMTIGLGAAER